MEREDQILGMITSQCTWEDVMYKVIAFEGLDPWDIDLASLADGFLKYLMKLKELDFRVPAKYIMVAAILLKMKSDYLRNFRKEDVLPQPVVLDADQPVNKLQIDAQQLISIPVPPRREPVRKIMLPELIFALKKALDTHTRREEKKQRLRERIDVTHEDMNKRIAELYAEISGILKSIKKREIKFSSLIKQGTRDEIISTFLPIIHLDHDQKLKCRQEEFFEEIWIGRPSTKN